MILERKGMVFLLKRLGFFGFFLPIMGFFLAPQPLVGQSFPTLAKNHNHFFDWVVGEIKSKIAHDYPNEEMILILDVKKTPHRDLYQLKKWKNRTLEKIEFIDDFKKKIKCHIVDDYGKSINLYFSLNRYKKMPTLHQMPKKKMITQDDLEWRWFKSEDINESMIMDPSHMIGMSLKKPDTSIIHHPLREEDIFLDKKEPLVKKNAPVEVVYHNKEKTLSIRTHGIAQHDGFLGDTIHIQRVDHDKKNAAPPTIIVAKVTGLQEAMISNP
jgi:hypothetical protein